MTDLVTSTGWPPYLSLIVQIGVRGHIWVTGVKKIIFTKNATPTDNVAWSSKWLMYVIDLKTPYESYAIRFWSKVIWGHRVKNKVNFQTSSNDKSSSVNVLASDKHQKNVNGDLFV